MNMKKRTLKSNNIHTGSNFDDFLKQEGLLAEAESVAIKRILAYQIEQVTVSMTQSELASKFTRNITQEILSPREEEGKKFMLLLN